MTKLLNFLSRTPVILFCFITMLILGASFTFFEAGLGGPMLDIIMNGTDAGTRLAEMSTEQRGLHLLITVTLDSLYPLANFGFFAGVAARLARSWRRWAVLPAFIYVIADFAENIVQMLALKGADNLLALKDILTPLKFMGFLAAAILVLALILIAFVKWVAGRGKA